MFASKSIAKITFFAVSHVTAKPCSFKVFFRFFFVPKLFAFSEITACLGRTPCGGMGKREIPGMVRLCLAPFASSGRSGFAHLEKMRAVFRKQKEAIFANIRKRYSANVGSGIP
jgi:hypothetical protein